MERLKVRVNDYKYSFIDDSKSFDHKRKSFFDQFLVKSIALKDFSH